MRALPKIDTAGWIACRRSVAVTNSAIISNIRHASRAEACERFTSWGSDGLGSLGDATVMAGGPRGLVKRKKKRHPLVGPPPHLYPAFHPARGSGSPGGGATQR